MLKRVFTPDYVATLSLLIVVVTSLSIATGAGNPDNLGIKYVIVASGIIIFIRSLLSAIKNVVKDALEESNSNLECHF